MKLIDNWKLILRKAWSLKFTAAAMVLGAIEVGIQFYQPESWPAGLFAALAALATAASAVARLLAQQEISDAK